MVGLFFFFFKQKTAYEMRISDWSSDVCSSDLPLPPKPLPPKPLPLPPKLLPSLRSRLRPSRRQGMNPPQRLPSRWQPLSTSPIRNHRSMSEIGRAHV